MLSALDWIFSANEKCLKVLTASPLAKNSVWWVIKQKCRVNVSIWINDWLNLQPPLISTFCNEKKFFQLAFLKMHKWAESPLDFVNVRDQFSDLIKTMFTINHIFPSGDINLISVWMSWASTWGQFGYPERKKTRCGCTSLLWNVNLTDSQFLTF